MKAEPASEACAFSAKLKHTTNNVEGKETDYDTLSSKKFISNPVFCILNLLNNIKKLPFWKGTSCRPSPVSLGTLHTPLIATCPARRLTAQSPVKSPVTHLNPAADRPVWPIGGKHVTVSLSVRMLLFYLSFFLVHILSLHHFICSFTLQHSQSKHFILLRLKFF
jgi:hypothetical protein